VVTVQIMAIMGTTKAIQTTAAKKPSS